MRTLGSIALCLAVLAATSGCRTTVRTETRSQPIQENSPPPRQDPPPPPPRQDPPPPPPRQDPPPPPPRRDPPPRGEGHIWECPKCGATSSVSGNCPQCDVPFKRQG
ncbi:hypothetical protein HY251_10700 [bacterium]|nr:hypothetical protein [bacterium]